MLWYAENKWAPLLKDPLTVQASTIDELRVSLYQALSQTHAGKKWLQEDAVGVDFMVQVKDDVDASNNATWAVPRDLSAVDSDSVLRIQQLRVEYSSSKTTTTKKKSLLLFHVEMPTMIEATVSGWFNESTGTGTHHPPIDIRMLGLEFIDIRMLGLEF